MRPITHSACPASTSALALATPPDAASVGRVHEHPAPPGPRQAILAQRVVPGGLNPGARLARRAGVEIDLPDRPVQPSQELLRRRPCRRGGGDSGRGKESPGLALAEKRQPRAERLGDALDGGEMPELASLDRGQSVRADARPRRRFTKTDAEATTKRGKARPDMLPGRKRTATNLIAQGIGEAEIEVGTTAAALRLPQAAHAAFGPRRQRGLAEARPTSGGAKAAPQGRAGHIVEAILRHFQPKTGAILRRFPRPGKSVRHGGQATRKHLACRNTHLRSIRTFPFLRAHGSPTVLRHEG